MGSGDWKGGSDEAGCGQRRRKRKIKNRLGIQWLYLEKSLFLKFIGVVPTKWENLENWW